ncbi:MAG: histidinol-phosphate transaminase [Pseudomonadota bacterium]
MTAPMPRPGIMDIKPYKGGEAEAEPNRTLGHVIRLASNEGALGPSKAAIDAYQEMATDIFRYPDGGATELRQALGAHFGLDPERIVCGAGSDELISLLVNAHAGPGDEVVYSQHGFLMYALAAQAAGAKPVVAPETGLRSDVDALLATVTDRTKLLFIANPNNPTGSYLTVEEMERLQAGLPPHVLLVIDAAYAEYVVRNDYSAGADLVDRCRNVVMTRTFSKMYALSGLRLGWAYCTPELADVLNRVRGPFNVNSAAQAAAVAALNDVAFQDASRTHNAIWRDWTSERLSDLGLNVYPSVTNFLLVDFAGLDGKDAEAARQFLKQNGILVRQMGAYGLPTCLRLSIGDEDEMRLVVDTIAEYLN